MEYNVDTNTWLVLAPPPLAADHSSAVVTNGCIIVMGGGYSNTIHHNIQTYDIAKKVWNVKKDVLPVPITMHFAFLH